MIAFTITTNELFWTISTWILTVLGFLLAVVLIAHLIGQKKAPSAALAWIMAIVLMPHIGVPLYIILGGRKMRRKESLKSNLDFKDTQAKLTAPEAQKISTLLQSFNMPHPAKGHRLKLCNDGVDAYEKLMDLLDSAQDKIHIATYVFQKDEVGQAVLAKLTEKLNQGVEVKLLVDDIGAHMLKKRHVKNFIAAGGKYARFMPLMHIHRRADLRDHRKITLIDGRTVMAGGMNIGNEYMGPTADPERWKDLSFVLEGPCVNFYSAIFAQDWDFATGQNTNEECELQRLDQYVFEEDAIAQIIPSGPDIEGDVLYNAIISAIYAAENRVWIVTPYFVPDDSLQQAFALAAHRGVSVELFIPQVSNQRLANLARGSYLRELQANGVKVNLYQPGMMHAKAMVVDDEIAMVGSANLDYRSLQLNYEVAMFTYSDDEIDMVEGWIENMRSDCKVGVPPEVKTFRNLVEGTARLIAPLL